MKTKRVSRKVKIKIYRTTIRPLVLYGRGTWILRQKNEKEEDGSWRRRTNKELKNRS